jgi:hypothetical protein
MKTLFGILYFTPPVVCFFGYAITRESWPLVALLLCIVSFIAGWIGREIRRQVLAREQEDVGHYEI